MGIENVVYGLELAVTLFLWCTASGSVYTWGRGQFGRMGMGVFQDELVPTLIEFEAMAMEHEDSPSSSAHPTDWDSVKRSRISQLAAGAYHSLALAGPSPLSLSSQLLAFFFSYVNNYI